MKMMHWKVVVASPSRSIRAALLKMLALRLGIKIITEAASAVDALEKLQSDRHDIILYDTEMGDLPLTHFISESGVTKRRSQALILLSAASGTHLEPSPRTNSTVRRLMRPFSSEQLISLLREIYDPIEYRKSVRVHPPEGVRVLINSGGHEVEASINDISLGGLSCSTAVADYLHLYSTATLTLLWNDTERGVQTTGRCSIAAEAIRFEALPPPDSGERQSLVAFRFLDHSGENSDFLVERIHSLIDATSREIG